MNFEIAFYITSALAAIFAARCAIHRHDAKITASDTADKRRTLIANHASEIDSKNAEIRRLRKAYSSLRQTRSEDIEAAQLEGYRRAKREFDEDLETTLRSQNRKKIHQRIKEAKEA